MINRLLYTFWTNEGNNLENNFVNIQQMVDLFDRSLEKSKEFFEHVVIYTDSGGKDFLEKAGVSDVEYVVLDYSQYKFNKEIWCFPKIITYSLQKERFLHIDMDLILEEKPRNLHEKLLCEKTRPLFQLSTERDFLPEMVKKHFNPINICSGALGGDPAIFKKLFTIASKVADNKNLIVTPEVLFGIEEIILTSIASANNISPAPIDCRFTHYQGYSNKSTERFERWQEEDLIIAD